MKHVLLLIALVAGGGVHSQVINPPPGSEGATDTTVWRGWTGISLGIKPLKGVSVVMNQQWRWDRDFSEFDRHLLQLGCAWSPQWNDVSKAQSLGIGVRRTSRPDRIESLSCQIRHSIRREHLESALTSPNLYNMQ